MVRALNALCGSRNPDWIVELDGLRDKHRLTWRVNASQMCGAIKRLTWLSGKETTDAAAARSQAVNAPT